MYSVKRAGQFGGGLQGGWLYVLRESPLCMPLFIPLPSFSWSLVCAQRLQEHLVADGRHSVLGGAGAGGVRLSTAPFFSEASFLLLLSTSVSPQTGQQPETGPRLSVATSSWPECVWRARTGWTPQLRHAPWRLPGLFTAKGSSALLWKGGACKRWRKRCGSVKKKRGITLGLPEQCGRSKLTAADSLVTGNPTLWWWHKASQTGF